MDITIPRGDSDSYSLVLNDTSSGTAVAQNLAGWKILTSTKRSHKDPDDEAVIPVKTYNIPAVSTSGTGTISSALTTVTGVGTVFTTELTVGDTITASGQTRTIATITSDTSLTVDTAFSPSLAGNIFTYIEGVYSYDITWSKTETNIDFGSYIFDIRCIDPDGNPTTVVGKFTISNTSTRQNS